MIRLAALTDVPHILELERLLFSENSLSEFALTRELDIGRCYVVGSPAVAYALVRHQPAVTDLLRLGVSPAHQRQGYGRRLLRHVLVAYGVVMLTVKKNNKPAFRMYRDAGFQIIGEVLVDGNAGWIMLRKG